MTFFGMAVVSLMALRAVVPRPPLWFTRTVDVRCVPAPAALFGTDHAISLPRVPGGYGLPPSVLTRPVYVPLPDGVGVAGGAERFRTDVARLAIFCVPSKSTGSANVLFSVLNFGCGAARLVIDAFFIGTPCLAARADKSDCALVYWACFFKSAGLALMAI